MPDFAYIARDAKGGKVTGTIAATNEKDAIAQLATKDIFALEVTPQGQGMASFNLFGGISGQQIATTYAQLAALLRSGVPLLRSLRVIGDQTSSAALKEILADVSGRVEEGSTLAEAMDRHRDTFGEMAVNMVRAGGEGGFLEEALERVAKFTEESEDLRSRTMGALAYPMFLACVGTIVVGILLIFFVPGFEEMFQRLRDQGNLPAVTEWLLAFSGFLGRWWLFLLAGMAGGGFFLWSFLRTPEGRKWGDTWKLKIPILGNIFESLAVAGFCRVLGTMLSNGVPILRALEISREAAGNVVLSEAIAHASENITSGASLAPPLRSSGYFPADVVEMIAVAEESNTLDDVLVNIADGLERRTSRSLDLFVRLLEPIMLLLLAIVVLVVVIALLLPILQMSTTIK